MKRSANLSRHVAELPADLIFDGSWSVGVSQTNSSECVGGGTQGVRTHMADGDGLTGGPRRGHCSRSFLFVHADASGKATADLVRSAQLSPGERTSPGDESPRAVIIWGFSLKDGQNALCTVGSPRRDKTSAGFAQRLWRCHNPPLRDRPSTDADLPIYVLVPAAWRWAVATPYRLARPDLQEGCK